MYGFIKIISIIVRQFYLPNPFECFGDKAVIYNWIAEPVIHLIAFGITGLFYSRGSEPATGSMIYLVVYVCLIGILKAMSLFSFAWWWVVLIVILSYLLFYKVCKLIDM